MNVLDALPTPGARLDHLCTLAGISLRDLDDLAGKVHPGHAAAIVRGGRGAKSGRRNPRPEAIEPYCAVLGTDVAYLLLGAGKPPGKRRVRHAVAAAQAAREARAGTENVRAHTGRVTPGKPARKGQRPISQGTPDGAEARR